jgi:dienelactone hydrolase
MRSVAFQTLRQFVALVLVCASSSIWAQAPVVDAGLNESVLMITKKGLFTLELETTLYKPDGDGPFPIALINHGKAPGDSRFQARYRPGLAARYFLQRGYAVVVPMRQGFSKSNGSYIGGGCNVESNGRVQAEDVKAALDYVTAQPWADKNQIVVVGQSHGGWTTLAFGAQNYPGVKALVNFAGGLRQPDCVGWENNLASGAAAYARDTRLKSLWFYGDNDSFFNTATYRAMHEKYTAAGGQAKLVAFGTFGTDAHSLFGSQAGVTIWQPEMTTFLAASGLPSESLAAYAKYAKAAVTVAPPSTDFADLADATKLPHVKDAGRAGYVAYLTKTPPRAFAIASTGAWGWAEGGEDPLARALANCNRITGATPICKLYSVDDTVVWTDK